MARSPRQEFSAAVDAEIKARAVDPEGVRRCENPCCRHPVKVDGERTKGAREAHVDHTVATWMLSATPVKERKPLTAEDGKLLCVDCHKEKSRLEAAARARCDAAKKRHDGTRRQRKAIPSRGFPKGRGFQKRSDCGHKPPSYWA